MKLVPPLTSSIFDGRREKIDSLQALNYSNWVTDRPKE